MFIHNTRLPYSMSQGALQNPKMTSSNVVNLFPKADNADGSNIYSIRSVFLRRRNLFTIDQRSNSNSTFNNNEVIYTNIIGQNFIMVTDSFRISKVTLKIAAEVDNNVYESNYRYMLSHGLGEIRISASWVR